MKKLSTALGTCAVAIVLLDSFEETLVTYISSMVVYVIEEKKCWNRFNQ